MKPQISMKDVLCQSCHKGLQMMTVGDKQVCRKCASEMKAAK